MGRIISNPLQGLVTQNSVFSVYFRFARDLGAYIKIIYDNRAWCRRPGLLMAARAIIGLLSASQLIEETSSTTNCTARFLVPSSSTGGSSKRSCDPRSASPPLRKKDSSKPVPRSPSPPMSASTTSTRRSSAQLSRPPRSQSGSLGKSHGSRSSTPPLRTKVPRTPEQKSPGPSLYRSPDPRSSSPLLRKPPQGKPASRKHVLSAVPSPQPMPSTRSPSPIFSKPVGVDASASKKPSQCSFCKCCDCVTLIPDILEVSCVVFPVSQLLYIISPNKHLIVVDMSVNRGGGQPPVRIQSFL